MHTFNSAYPARKLALNFIIKGILWALFLTALFSGQLQAQGNLVIFPRRMIFEENKTIQEFTLGNSGKDTAIYEISLVQMRMKKDGGFEVIGKPDSGQLFASPYLHYFPQKIILGPDETQKIRVGVSDISKMPEGEYRSHLSFRAVSAKKITAKQSLVPGTFSVQIIPYFGISVPIIIRAGNIQGKVNIQGMSLTTSRDDSEVLNMILKRSGAASVYGSVVVNYISASGQKRALTNIDGLAIYTPNTQRSIHIALPALPGLNYKTGALEIIYKSAPGFKLQTYSLVKLSLK